MKNICIDPRKKIPINIGAIPAVNLFHQISLNIKYITPAIKLKNDIINPVIDTNLKGVVEMDVNEYTANDKYLHAL